MFLLLVFCLLDSSESRTCFTDFRCSSDQKCCNNVCRIGRDCVGSSCHINKDCSSGESCCNNVCSNSSDCLGMPCGDSFNCKSWETCCEGMCLASGNCFPFLFIGSMFGAIIFVLLLFPCICFICRRRQSIRHGRFIFGRGQARISATTRIYAPPSTQPYQRQADLPSYVEVYPPIPPPQYDPHPMLCSADASKAPDLPPPPYTAVADQESADGEVFTSQHDYGT